MPSSTESGSTEETALEEAGDLFAIRATVVVDGDVAAAATLSPETREARVLGVEGDELVTGSLRFKGTVCEGAAEFCSLEAWNIFSFSLTLLVKSTLGGLNVVDVSVEGGLLAGVTELWFSTFPPDLLVLGNCSPI